MSLTIQTTLGSLPILGPHPVTVEEGSVSVPRSATSPHAWTMHRWVVDGGNSIEASSSGTPAQEASGGSSSLSSSSVSSALFVGWRNVAPDGSGLYTLTAMQDGQSVSLTTSPVSGENALIMGGSTSFNWCDTQGTARDITIQDLGSNTTTGIVPPRPDPDLCVDPISGLTYATSWSTYATDHLGTVRAVVTDNQDGTSSIQKFDYEPFGVELFNPANVGCGNTHKFTGHERDAETQNDYMHFRYFSASMGRFQKPDNVFDGAAGNPQGFNLYSYVSGNPVNFNDPTGHMSVEAGRRVAEGEYIDIYNTTEQVAASLGGVPDTEKGEGLTRDEKKQGKVQTKLVQGPPLPPEHPLSIVNPVSGERSLSDSEVRNDGHGSGSFQDKRSDNDKHSGTDVAGSLGTELVAPVSGNVVEGRYWPEAGVTLTISTTTTDKLVVLVSMGHLDAENAGATLKELPGQKESNRNRLFWTGFAQVPSTTVTQGTAVANIGNTGNARGTDPHVHLGVTVFKDGKKYRVDPQKVISQQGFNDADLVAP